jgi:hypothetical protein
MSERDLQNQIFIRLNSRRDVRVFRNNVGVGFIGTEFADKDKLIDMLQLLFAALMNGVGKNVQQILHETGVVILKYPRRIRFGLHEGSADLIGWKSIKITPDMVGQKIAVFVSAEIKGPHGRMREEQNNWMAQVLIAGGHAYEIRDIRQADKI